MKALLTTITAALFLLPAGAAEAEKPLVTLSVKRQVLDSDHDLHGRRGDSRQKTLALRVEIANTSQVAVGESSLTGDVLINRAGKERETLVRESLSPVKVPALKPGERLTFDLGKIQVSEIEWRNRKFEETLEEWQVTCTSGNTELGKAVSSDRYQALSKEVPAISKKQATANPPRKPLRRKVE